MTTPPYAPGDRVRRIGSKSVLIVKECRTTQKPNVWLVLVRDERKGAMLDCLHADVLEAVT